MTTRYLLDTSVLIQAKNDYYKFDVCPGFWAWMEEAHSSGTVLSIRPVLSELKKGKDDLAAWAKSLPDSFFPEIDENTTTVLGGIARWVQENRVFSPASKALFQGGADPLLIAYAKAHECTIVTLEVGGNPNSTKVKIPTVCREFNVPCVRTFQMLSEQKAQFVLKRAGLRTS